MHNGDGNDDGSDRTVAVIVFPGRREYWITDNEFTVGETIERYGETWTVSDVTQGVTGKNRRVRLTPEAPHHRSHASQA